MNHVLFKVDIHFLNVFLFHLYVELAGSDKEPNRAQIELRLIKSMNDLLNPQVDYKASVVKF